MSYYTQPIINHFYEIAPGDTITIPAKSAIGWNSAVSWTAERAPLYDSSGATDPSAAIWVSTTGNDGATHTGASTDPVATIARANTIINAGTTRKWIVLKDGTYRQTYPAFGAKVIGLTGAKNAKVWLDGSKSINGSTFTGSGPYQTTLATAPAFLSVWGDGSNMCVFLDGVPQVWTSGTPSAGQYTYASKVLKLGSNPSGKTVEYIDINKAGPETGVAGFTFQYLGMRRFASQMVNLKAANQTLFKVVLAYSNGPDGKSVFWTQNSAKDVRLEEVVMTHCGAKPWWHSGQVSGSFPPGRSRCAGVRIDSGNWTHHHDARPGNHASLGGTKQTSTSNVWDDNVMFRNNQTNGLWFDIQCQHIRTTRFYLGGNAGYGATDEVGLVREWADGIVTNNGTGHLGSNMDGFRLSGVAQAGIYNVTTLNNHGANLGLYEDSRQYGGVENGCRRFDGVTMGHDHSGAPTGRKTPGLGDNFAWVMKGNVFLKGPNNSKQNIDGSQGGPGTILDNTENAHNGFLQTVPMSTRQAFSPNPIAGTLGVSGLGPNVYINVKDNGKSIKWLTPNPAATMSITFVPGQASKIASATTSTGWNNSTLYAVSEINGLNADLEDGSLDVGTAGESIGKYFPHAADTTPKYTWWDESGGKIPGTTTNIPTYTLASDEAWVAAALGVSAGATVKAGCHRAPVPTQIGGGGGSGSVPDIATLTTPADGASISGSSVAVSATGHDPDDGTSITVELRADGNSLSTPLNLTHTTGNTFTGTLNSNLLSDGDHDLRVRVTDSDGNWIASTKNTVTVSNGADSTGPTVTALTLSDGATITGPTVVSASVTDTSGVDTVTLVVTGDDGTEYHFTMS